MPQVAMIPGIREVILGPTGTYLLGATNSAVLEIDPDALTVSATYEIQNSSLSFPGINLFINNLALTNDGYVAVTFGCRCGSAFAPIYFFSTSSHTFTQLRPQSRWNFWSIPVSGAHEEMANVSADGATVLLGRPYAYNPATGTPVAQYFTQQLRSNNVPRRLLDQAIALAACLPPGMRGMRTIVTKRTSWLLSPQFATCGAGCESAR